VNGNSEIQTSCRLISNLLGRLGLSLLIAVVLVVPVFAATTQVVLFTGFGAGPGPNTGMDLLNTRLAAAGIPDYLSQVFEWTEHDAALEWVQFNAASRGTLVLIGHSFGGNSALQLADEYLRPLSVTVDLTVQIDPVKNFLPGANDVLPSNVEVGFNYYQISTGFLEPQGEDFVTGATNFNAEMLFNDTSITHTSIDDDARLHTRIAANILANLNPASADFDNDGDIDGRDFLVWQRGGSPDSFSAGDLSLWQSQYGNPALNADAVAVPEPGALELVLLVVLSTSVARRR
jgi:pimeloyl-ACP methyl ester carboxylesterase